MFNYPAHRDFSSPILWPEGWAVYKYLLIAPATEFLIQLTIGSKGGERTTKFTANLLVFIHA